MNVTHRSTLPLLAALFAASLAGCGGGEVGGQSAATPTTGSDAPTATVPLIDQAAVPTEDEAYEAARDQIDADNVDEEMRRLLEEIEGSD